MTGGQIDAASPCQQAADRLQIAFVISADGDHPVDGIYFVGRKPQRIAFYDFATHQVRALLQPEQRIPSDEPALTLAAATGSFSAKSNARRATS